jgi:hypothetical protein
VQVHTLRWRLSDELMLRACTRARGPQLAQSSHHRGRLCPLLKCLKPAARGGGGARRAQLQQWACRARADGGRGSPPEDVDERPTKFELTQRPDKQKPLVRVRLSVHYRVHSRQMLCIGGSLIPFGWSFLSIAKVPMTWNCGDVWTCEVG